MHVFQQFFGSSLSDSGEDDLAGTQLARYQRSLVAKLRSISDTSCVDDVPDSTAYVGWCEVARGWRSTKPFPNYVCNSEIKTISRTSKDNFSQRETLPLPLHWRDIVRFSSKATKPTHIPNPGHGKSAGVSMSKVNVKLDRKRLEKLTADHAFSSPRPLKATKAKNDASTLPGRDKESNQREQRKSPVESHAEIEREIAEKICQAVSKEAGSVVSDGWAKFMNKLPNLNQQIKEDNQLVERLASRCRSRENPDGPTQIALHYGTSGPELRRKSLSKNLPNFLQSGNRSEKNTRICKKTSAEHKDTADRKEGAPKVAFGSSQKSMTLPSINVKSRSKPGPVWAPMQYRDAAATLLRRQAESANEFLDRLHSQASTPTKQKPKRTSSPVEEKKVDEGGDGCDWKFAPFLPPILNQHSKLSKLEHKHWKVQKKPSSNMIAITQGTLKAGVNSNSIYKLTRSSTLNGITGSKVPLPLVLHSRALL